MARPRKPRRVPRCSHCGFRLPEAGAPCEDCRAFYARVFHPDNLEIEAAAAAFRGDHAGARLLSHRTATEACDR